MTIPLACLSRLRVDRSTGDPAPHKPLLLLVFLGLFAEGEIAGDTIALTPEISFRFSNYWSVVGTRRRQRPDVRMPFHHLKGDGLVTPLTLDGRESPTKEVTVAVRLSEELIRVGRDETLRRQAQLMLIRKYFPADEQLGLCEMLAFSPSEVELVGESLSRASEPEAVRRGRDARFRQVVVSAYDFTCALTGHRLITISAGSLVDAAHIRPVAHEGPCLIGNGVALCKNAHWAFDCGLWTFDSEYRVPAQQPLLLPRWQQGQAEQAPDVAAVDAQRVGDVLDAAEASGVQTLFPDVGSGQGDEDGLLGLGGNRGLRRQALGNDNVLPPAAVLHPHRDVQDDAVAYFEGQISAAFACKEDPTRVVVIKGNKPLSFRYHKKARAVLYSSLEEHLDEVTAEDPAWRDLDISPMTLAIFNTDAVGEPELHPVRFRAIRRAPAKEEQAP